MEDSLYLGAFVYIFLAVTISSLLPTSFYIGDDTQPDGTDLLNQVDPANADLTSTADQWNFLLKIVTFLFAPFLISGVPGIVGIIISAINYFAILIGIIFIYDKVRGI
jgi:hypothetical protein